MSRTQVRRRWDGGGGHRPTTPVLAVAKYGMSMCVLGMAHELRRQKIGVNALWPRTAIATAAVQNLLGGDEMMRRSRKPEIMGDAAFEVLTSDPARCTANFFIDEHVLFSALGDKFDPTVYSVDPSIPQHQLVPDFFC